MEIEHSKMEWNLFFEAISHYNGVSLIEFHLHLIQLPLFIWFTMHQWSVYKVYKWIRTNRMSYFMARIPECPWRICANGKWGKCRIIYKFDWFFFLLLSKLNYECYSWAYIWIRVDEHKTLLISSTLIRYFLPLFSQGKKFTLHLLLIILYRLNWNLI